MKNVINQYFEEEEKYRLHIIRTNGEEIDIYFSKEDYSLISNIRWTFKYDNKNNEPRIRATTGNHAGQDLSTILFNNSIDTNLFVDHINRNTLDNTRENLRLVNRSVNASNARARTESKTSIRGVSFRKERPGIAKASWICEWSFNGERHTKSFSIAKYGNEQAFSLACKLRQEKMKEMKI